MVGAVHEPRRESVKLDTVDVRHALVQAEPRDRPRVLVPVLDQGTSLQVADDVVGEHLGLPHGVLRVGRAVLSGIGHVRHARDVTGREGALDAGDGELVGGLDAAPLVERQIARVDHRAGLDPGRPHDRGRLEGVAVREHHVATLAGLQKGLHLDLDAPLAQLLQGPLAHLGADLGKDAVAGLDEHPAEVLLAEGVVVLHRVPAHVLKLGQSLDARETGADHDEVERPPAHLLVVGGVRPVEEGENAVAQRDGFADRLEPDRGVREPRDGQRARDGAGRHDDDVVPDLLARPGGGLERHGPVGVMDLGDLAIEDPDLGQHPAQRRDDVTRGQVARRGLGKEGLVGHVGLRVDDRDPDASGLQLAAQRALKPESCVETDVPSADDEDVLGLLVHLSAPSWHGRL